MFNTFHPKQKNKNPNKTKDLYNTLLKVFKHNLKSFPQKHKLTIKKGENIRKNKNINIYWKQI